MSASSLSRATSASTSGSRSPGRSETFSAGRAGPPGAGYLSHVSTEAGTSRVGTIFPLRPIPERGGLCPRCERDFRIHRVRIGGWRMLLEGGCDICGHDYLQDLPAGHGLVYPTTLDLNTGETIDDAGAGWFASPLRGIWECPDAEPV